MKTNLDTWYDEFNRSSPKDQYQKLITCLKTESVQTKDEIDLLVDCLLQILGKVEFGNLSDKYFEIATLVQEKHPQLYESSFMYLNDFWIDYCLFQKNDKKLEELLAIFIKHPIEGCDELIAVLGHLVFYQKNQIALELSKKVFSKIKNSKKLIGGTDYYFGKVIYAQELQTVYIMSQSSEADWHSFEKTVEQYGFYPCEHTKKELMFLQEYIQTSLPETKEEQAKLYKKVTPDRYVAWVGYEFSKHMLQRQGVSFLCSMKIWEIFVEFMNEYLPKNIQHIKSLNVVFTFSEEKLNQYLGSLYGGILSRQQADAVVLLWGIPHLYDFLLSKEVITPDVHLSAIKIVQKLKPSLQKIAKTDLWKYAFWKEWGCPKHQSSPAFLAENEIFRSSLDIKTPLSEEVPEQEEDDFDEDWEEEENSADLALAEKYVHPNTEPLINDEKIGRNEACPCGSGKKYKKCCL